MNVQSLQLSSVRSLPGFNRVVFASGTRDHGVLAVVAGAWFRGELAAPWESVLISRAAQERADDLGQEPGDGELQALVDDFRYERDLLTTEELERWLLLRDLTEADFCDHFVRRYWQENLEEKPDVQRVRLSEASPDFWERLRADLLISGEFEQMMDRLAWRLSAAESESEPVEPDQFQQERSAFLQRVSTSEDERPGELAAFGLGRDWLDSMISNEVIFHKVCNRVLTPERRMRAIPSMRLALTAVRIESITVSSSTAACEGEVRAGRWWHALFRRNRRHEPDRPGESIASRGVRRV